MRDEGHGAALHFRIPSKPATERASYDEGVNLTIDLDREEDGRWIAEALELPGVLSYGKTREQAISNAERLAIEVIADRITHGELPSSALNVSFTITDEQMARH
jgi:predicted RNase H-like HicB family nuclease